MNKLTRGFQVIPVLFLMTLSFHSTSQSFEPNPDEAGSNAIYKDSSIIIDWANNIEIERGPKDIQQASEGLVNHGLPSDATSIADNMAVSLGDGGVAIATFAQPIRNGNGPDFAIFENGFANNYMELAFVEVSSDGIQYTRFPSISETPSDIQLDNFSFFDCRFIHNLAGKYRVHYGTPFDLEELEGLPGLDINNIIKIRIIDVIGSISPEIGSQDSQGNIINDPYPTPFESGGFDLDAIGIIHTLNSGIDELSKNLKLFPNPVKDVLNLKGFSDEPKVIINNMGKEIKYFEGNQINISELQEGIYTVRQGIYFVKFIKN